jgi:four helix bundle protein
LQIENLKLQIAAMTPDELKARTKEFALRILKLVAALPRSIEGRTIVNQLARCGTSVAANYRAACRARSRAEFVAKIGVVLEEADESQVWLELIIDGKFMSARRAQPLLNEATELVAIFIATRESAASNLKFAI